MLSPNLYSVPPTTTVGHRTMCHHHKPIELIAKRRAEAEDESEAEDAAPEMPTLTPPADD